MPDQNYSDNRVEDAIRRFDHEKENHHQVAKILGYEPPYLPRSNEKYAMRINLSAPPILEPIIIKTYGAAKQM